MTPQRVRVVYIAGAGRSGSTLLERMLGHVPGFLPAGELKNIWHRGFVDNQLCSCGKPFSECDFWASAVRDAYGDLAAAPSERLAQLDRDRNRTRYIPELRFPRLRSNEFARDLSAYQDALVPLYQSLGRRPGTTAVVDSSKNVPYAFLLGTIPEIELHVVHLVRDSRAVAYSWRKLVRRPEVTARDEYMGGFHPGTTAARWALKNTSTELLRFSARSYARVRYEDLVEDPPAALGRILAGLGEKSGYAPSGDPKLVPVPPVYHTVSGNPIRLDRDTLQVRPDVEWRTNLDAASKLVAGAVTLPLLARYGYFSPRRESRRRGASNEAARVP